MDAEALKRAIDSLEGDYELVKELGQGATSVVYLLRDRGLDRDVALKVIKGGMGSDEEALARLQREAHLVAQLQHPNIVKLYGTHRLPDGSFSLLMEHVPGKNLKEILRRDGALPAARVLEILKDVASALAYAHRRRIVHRDVKPENIYIDEEVGSARLADFGVARPWDQDSRLTVPGASLGTPAYMSPEQIDGKEVDGRSDVYSLGLVGYEMILGRHPWEGENVFTTIFKQKKETLEMNLPGLKEVPVLAAILERSLKKDPEERWDSTDALLAELKAVPPPAPTFETDPFEAFRSEVLGRDEDAPPGTLEKDGESSGDLPGTSEAPSEEAQEGELPPIDWSGLEDEPEPGRAFDLQVIEEEERLPEKEEEAPVARRRKRSPVARVAVPLVLIVGILGGYWLWPRAQEVGTLEGVAPAAEERVAQEPEVPATEETQGQGPGSPTPETGGQIPSDASLLALNGGRLEDRVGTRVPLVMRVSRPDGAALSGRQTVFEIVEGEGALEAETVRTDETGLAEATLQLPETVQEVVVRGGLSGLEGREAMFRIRVLPGLPFSVSRIMGDGQTGPPGEALEDFLGVRVQDRFGNPIPNTDVRFEVLEGGGAVQPREARTDEAGRAFARWTLGSDVGGQAVMATVPGAQEPVVTFRATGEAPLETAAPEGSTTDPAPSEPVEEAPSPLSVRVRSQPLAVGGGFVCGLRNRSPECSGNIERRPGSGSNMGGIRALSAGVSHGCGLTESGMAWCWGSNESGQLGDGTTRDRDAAVLVQTNGSFSQLMAGLSHTCGLDAAGAAFCWGRNVNGQLGDRSRQDRSTPGPVQDGASFRSLAAGWNHTCGLSPGGQLLCWGLNGDGQLGDGTRIDRLVPTPVSGSFQTVAAGSGHTCGISGDRVLCWGSNQFGQLGNGTPGTAGTSTPAPVQGLPSPPRSVTVGAVHTCALLSNGEAYCWGQNLHGQLGDGTAENRALPVQVEGGLSFVSLYAGGAVTCGLADDGARYCWGMNQNGQLGDGTRVNRSSPVRVGGTAP